MLSFWKVMLKSPTFWPFFSTNLSQKHKINFLSNMKLVTVPQKLFPNPKSNFTICEKNWQWLELVWQRCNFFSIFPIFHFSSRLPICRYNKPGQLEILRYLPKYYHVMKRLEIAVLSWTENITIVCLWKFQIFCLISKISKYIGDGSPIMGLNLKYFTYPQNPI